MTEVFLQPWAERDLRRIGPGPDRTRVLEGLQKLASQVPHLDIKPLTGASPWLRLRVGDHRVLFGQSALRTGPGSWSSASFIAGSLTAL